MFLHLRSEAETIANYVPSALEYRGDLVVDDEKMLSWKTRSCTSIETCISVSFCRILLPSEFGVSALGLHRFMITTTTYVLPFTS
ncbi:hypothetical protein Mapa_009313 [Marchantia paleacea]|nr:hypothetical protein Mapa_009313 [Marchantia paleacea]